MQANKMPDDPAEIDISSKNESGQTIHGRYRVAAGVIHVTLSDGTSTEAPLGSEPEPTIAKIMLQELDRKRRSVS